jgi:hypothetical protein
MKTTIATKTTATAQAAESSSGGRASVKTPSARARRAVQVTTAWGPAALVEEVRIPQAAGEKRFTTVFQLLDAGGREPLVRIAYTTGGVARRGPVTLRARDLKRLHAALAGAPALAAALGLGGEAA